MNDTLASLPLLTLDGDVSVDAGAAEVGGATAAPASPATFVADAALMELDAPEIDPGHGALYTWATLCLDSVYEYTEKQPDGSLKVIREWNSPAAVDAMARLAPLAPVTHLHPRENVTPHNVSRLAVGDATSDYLVVDGDEEVGPTGSAYKRRRALVPLAIRTAAGQQAATTDARFCSPGYQPIREYTPGIHPLDGPYDRVRVGIEYVNHIALVPNPRGGMGCALALDGLSAEEAQAALDAAPPMGYAVANGTPRRVGSLPRPRHSVKSTAKDSTMTLDEMIALLTQAFAAAKADPTGGLMRSLADTFMYSEPFRLAQAKAAGQVLARALMPEATPAATDAEIPTDPAELRKMLLELVREEIAAAMKMKPEGSEVEISLGDAYAGLMKDMGAMKAAMDGMKGKLDSMGDLTNKVATAAADAKLAKDSAASACQLATAAKDAADAFKTAEAARLAQDAADAATRDLAEVRSIGKHFGMAATVADSADKATVAAHLRSKYLPTVRATDADDAVIAAARALRSRPGGSILGAQDSAQSLPISPGAACG